MKEENIRPADLHEEYLRLCKKDSSLFFTNSVKRWDLLCPACDGGENPFAFSKDGFGYVRCQTCGTLFQSPRPAKSSFDRFYIDSPSSTYWAETFFPKVAESRREHIFKPRVEYISEYCQKNDMVHDRVLDVGAGYGIFLEEWRKRHPDDSVCAIEPGAKLANICRMKDIETLEALAENAEEWAGRADLTTCFEVIEHVYSPFDLICSMVKLTKPGGYILLSGLGADGYDIQVLWDQSKSVSPPHHINFMSVKGFEILLERAGCDDIDIFTPGKLDVEIVRKAMQSSPELLQGNRFAGVLSMQDEKVQKEFQDFLSKNKMSSHVWMIAKCPEEK